MRYIVSAVALSLLLVGCGPAPSGTPTPDASGSPATANGANGSGATAGGSTTVGAGGALATKQAYINFLTCLKTQPAYASASAGIDAQIAAINQVPDTTWAQVSASYNAVYQGYMAALGTACR
jgi:hypothetical protein